MSGTIYLDKSDVVTMNGNEFAKKMAVVLTDKLKTELMTCYDVVATGRYPYTGRFGVLSDEDKKAVDEAMELVNVSQIKDKDFTKISDGQKAARHAVTGYMPAAGDYSVRRAYIIS